MKIDLQRIKVREVVDGYVDNNEEGVKGYGGKLDIRPKFQREFVYNDKKRSEVIRSIRKGFPLNVMYWVVNKEIVDGIEFGVLDGQQRTISIGQYVNNDFSIDGQFFGNLTNEEQEQILDYELMIYLCEGEERDVLDWFEIINIAGEVLTPQELRNAVYTGPWLSAAKLIFSKNNCAAWGLASDYVNGSPNRQEYLETAIRWMGNETDVEIRDYMGRHQKDTNADEIWGHFQEVIHWVVATFPNYRKIMKGLDWGTFYAKYSKNKYDAEELEGRINELLQDDDVTKPSGVYEYLLSGDERYLSIRAFSEKEKLAAYERQGGICVKCGKHFELGEMVGDHIIPWSKGGKTVAENCQMLCAKDNAIKSDK